MRRAAILILVLALVGCAKGPQKAIVKDSARPKPEVYSCVNLQTSEIIRHTFRYNDGLLRPEAVSDEGDDVLFVCETNERQIVEAYDCETSGEPVEGRAVCANLSIGTNGWSSAALNDMKTTCRLSSSKSEDLIVSQLFSMAWVEVFQFGKLHAGRWSLICDLDSENVIAETNEHNNRVEFYFDVFPQSMKRPVDLSIRDKGSVVLHPQSDTPPWLKYAMTVEVENTGDYAAIAQVRCKSPTRKDFAVANSYVRAMPHAVSVVQFSSDQQKFAGGDAMLCTVGIAKSDASVDTNPGNNSRTVLLKMPPF